MGLGLGLALEIGNNSFTHPFASGLFLRRRTIELAERNRYDYHDVSPSSQLFMPCCSDRQFQLWNGDAPARWPAGRPDGRQWAGHNGGFFDRRRNGRVDAIATDIIIVAIRHYRLDVIR